MFKRKKHPKFILKQKFQLLKNTELFQKKNDHMTSLTPPRNKFCEKKIRKN